MIDLTTKQNDNDSAAFRFVLLESMIRFLQANCLKGPEVGRYPVRRYRLRIPYQRNISHFPHLISSSTACSHQVKDSLEPVSAEIFIGNFRSGTGKASPSTDSIIFLGRRRRSYQTGPTPN